MRVSSSGPRKSSATRPFPSSGPFLSNKPTSTSAFTTWPRSTRPRSCAGWRRTRGNRALRRWGGSWRNSNADRSVLIVFNHPLWDMAGIGHELTLAAATRFLKIYGPRIHALEINGLRSWPENMGVVHLAQESGHPVVSGGDRHGLEPNATINLTRAVELRSVRARNSRGTDQRYRHPAAIRRALVPSPSPDGLGRGARASPA